METIQTADVELTRATSTQLPAIHRLVNLAYRGRAGWTRETELVEGDRASPCEVEAALSSPRSHLLVAATAAEVRACIRLTQEGRAVHIGLFAVHPDYQGQGLGRRVLTLAEDYAVNTLGCSRLLLTVVSQRPELIAYYQRRGYLRSGHLAPYPVELDVGTPKVGGLTLTTLEKVV